MTIPRDDMPRGIVSFTRGVNPACTRKPPARSPRRKYPASSRDTFRDIKKTLPLASGRAVAVKIIEKSRQAGKINTRREGCHPEKTLPLTVIKYKPLKSKRQWLAIKN
jgi:hypothetical protein